jgi:hypothetical protein
MPPIVGSTRDGRNEAIGMGIRRRDGPFRRIFGVGLLASDRAPAGESMKRMILGGVLLGLAAVSFYLGVIDRRRWHVVSRAIRMRIDPRHLRTLAILGWTAGWIVLTWAIDPASTAGLHPKPPAWVLFEVWAIGFVILGATWNTLLIETGPTADRVRTELDRHMRTITWAILVWTALWVFLFVIWAMDPGRDFIGEGPAPIKEGRLKPPEFLVFDVWFIGFVILGASWLVIRWKSARHRRA